MGRKGRLILVISAVVILIAIITTLIVLIISNVEPGISSYPAEKGEYILTYKTNGYFFKDDNQITNNQIDKMVKYVFENDYVTTDQLIAQIFPNATKDQITELSEICLKIDKLTKTSDYLKLSMTETEASMVKYSSLLDETKDSRLFSYYSYIFDILKLRHDLFYSSNSDYKYELMALEEQKKLLLQNMGESIDVKSNYDGIYSAYCDGYESLLLTSSIPNLELLSDNYLSAFNSHIENNVFGIITSSESNHCICKIENVDFDVSKTNKIYLSDFNIELEVKTNIIHTDKSGKNLIVDFEFDKEIVLPSSRLVSVDIVKSCFEGLKVQKKDLYDIKGTSCIYINDDGVAKIREVNIVSALGEYYIVNSENITKYPPLLVGEEIITGANRIYDGKKLK